jgi:hypothetical protein
MDRGGTGARAGATPLHVAATRRSGSRTAAGAVWPGPVRPPGPGRAMDLISSNYADASATDTPADVDDPTTNPRAEPDVR